MVCFGSLGQEGIQSVVGPVSHLVKTAYKRISLLLSAPLASQPYHAELSSLTGGLDESRVQTRTGSFLLLLRRESRRLITSAS